MRSVLCVCLFVHSDDSRTTQQFCGRIPVKFIEKTALEELTKFESDPEW